MGKRWITGQEILDEFGLQPFELRDIIAATKEGKTLSGQEVGYAAYLVQLNGTYPITGRHIEIARSMPSAIMAYERLEEIEKQRQAETVYQQGGVTMSLHIGNNTPLDERIGAYYVLSPSKYKTETGIDIELFFNDIPTFVFTEDEYATIKKIVEEEGLAPEEDAPAPVAVGQDAPCVAHKSAMKPTLSKKDQDRQDALAVAAGYWEANPELRPMQVAEAILENRRVKWRCKKPPEQKTLRDWLAPHAPQSAKKTGRPRGIPKE